jgi:hypothetical protein
MAVKVRLSRVRSALQRAVAALWSHP